jgi:hypothetical protein
VAGEVRNEIAMRKKKIKNLLDMKKTLRINGKKKTMIRALVNAETKTHINKSIEVNVELTMDENINEYEC